MTKSLGSLAIVAALAVATIRFDDGTDCRAEVHWYEAHGLGRQELKIKRLL